MFEFAGSNVVFGCFYRVGAVVLQGTTTSM